MKVNILRFLSALTLIILLSCTSTRSSGNKHVEGPAVPQSNVTVSAIQGTPFGPVQEFVGSPYKEIGTSGLFNVHLLKPAVLPYCTMAMIHSQHASKHSKMPIPPFGFRL
jgi:hypothetical protein